MHLSVPFSSTSRAWSWSKRKKCQQPQGLLAGGLGLWGAWVLAAKLAQAQAGWTLGTWACWPGPEALGQDMTGCPGPLASPAPA